MRNLDARREDEYREEKRDTGAAGPPRGQGEVVAFENPQLEAHEPVLSREKMEELRAQWTTIQSDFVDQPRTAVENADRLVATAIQQLSESFTQQRSHLEGQWTRGEEVSTEDLRLALQRYRDFFGRLLSI